MNPNAPALPMLAVRRLAKAFGGTRVAADISLQVARGETVALLGPNGAGKTTLFSMITGIERPDAGSIFIDGIDVTGWPVHTRARLGLSYMPQEPSVFRGLSVKDNILLYLENLEGDRRRRQARLDKLLAELDLGAVAGQKASRLSGGQRRRCEIARALAGEPLYMLLDEPFAGVDPLAVSHVQDTIRDLKKRGIGVLISDHNVRETLAIVDRAYVIESGRLLAQGTPAQVIADEAVRHLYLGESFTLGGTDTSPPGPPV